RHKYTFISYTFLFQLQQWQLPPHLRRDPDLQHLGPDRRPLHQVQRRFLGGFFQDCLNCCGKCGLSEGLVCVPLHLCSSSNTYRVYLGKHNLQASNEAGSMAIAPAKIVVHENWDSARIRNDIALIKLQTPVAASNTIMPSCLPQSGAVLGHNTPCYVTGWGRLWTGGPIADILQQARLPVVSYSVCSQPDWWGTLVTNSMVCAGGDGQLASCNGDSGGPLNCQNSQGIWEVHGIVSFGSSLGCNYPKKPSVFTRVSAYSSWISNVSSDTRHTHSVATSGHDSNICFSLSNR
uniref:pancreatic elastase II n=1 Tax=Denticeps clupeoides TaxID=299321 RepID=A0AAY4BAU1_9TELE